MNHRNVYRLGTTALLGALLAACAEAPQPADAPAANAEVCQRECLEAMAGRFLTALAARDASALPLAPDVRYTENGQELALDDGLWGTASEVGRYRQVFTDSRGDELGLFATMQENGAMILLGARLRLRDGQVTEIENIVNRPASGTSAGFENLERNGSPAWWNEAVPEAERMSREDLIVAAGKYFIALENNDGRGEYPFTGNCYRFENGNLATGNPEMARLSAEAARNPGRVASGQPGATGLYLMSLPCKEQFEWGYMKMVDRVRDRRFPVVDVERGVVFTLVFFDHSGTVHEVTTTDGQTHRINLRQPFTWEIAEAFKIDKGEIRAIEAVLTQSPYGMKPNWPAVDDAANGRQGS